MNACFMLEFKNADQEMNQTYGKLLETLEITGRQKVRTAQRAWLNYRDLHCDAIESAGWRRKPRTHRSFQLQGRHKSQNKRIRFVSVSPIAYKPKSRC